MDPKIGCHNSQIHNYVNLDDNVKCSIFIRFLDLTDPAVLAWLNERIQTIRFGVIKNRFQEENSKLDGVNRPLLFLLSFRI